MTEATSTALRTALAYYQAWTSHDLDQAMSYIADEEGVPFRDIAEAIGRQLKLPAVSVAPGDAGDHFGFLAAIRT